MMKFVAVLPNEAKTVRSEWENDDSNFLQALYCLYKKIRTIIFHTLLAIHCSVANYKYFKKLIHMKTLVF